MGQRLKKKDWNKALNVAKLHQKMIRDCRISTMKLLVLFFAGINEFLLSFLLRGLTNIKYRSLSVITFLIFISQHYCYRR